MFKKKIKLYTDISDKAEEGKILAQQIMQQWEDAKSSITNARQMIEPCKNKGIAVVNAIMQLNKAQEKFDSGDYKKSKEMADKALRMAVGAEKSWKGAKDAIENAKNEIRSGVSKGISFSELDNDMKKTDELLDSGDYDKSQELARHIETKVSRIIERYKEASEIIEETKALIEEGRQQKIMIPDSLFQDAISAFQSQKYDDAIDYANTTKHRIERAFSLQTTAKETLKECSDSIQSAKQYIFTDEVQKMLDDANQAYDKGDFDKTVSLARSCEEETRRLFLEGEPIISVAMPTVNLQARIFNRCALTVTNSGKVHVKDVKIDLEGKIEVDGLSPIPLLRANDSKNLEIALKADAEGSIPVKISVNCLNAANDKLCNIQESTWLTIGTVTPTAGASEAKVLRETEFFRGFIRMKVAVQNDMPSVITDVAFKPIVDEKVLRMSHIEPDYIIKHSEIQLGNINPKEKKTVAVFFDPMICTTSNINGSVSYKDSGGNFRTGPMKPKEVNVICPIFFTEDTANPAMLINLVKNVLKHQDSKVFNIPQGLTPKKAFEITKEAIQQRHIKFIRDFHQKSPYIAEAWYYGITKVKQYQMVIRCDVREETNSIQIFVASSDERALTGLLAELGHNLEKALKEKGISQPITQVTNITIKDSIVQRSSLL
ncbi:MAG: hypothetical protein JSW28_06435, partial [Thermoplasmata archaeon]